MGERLAAAYYRRRGCRVLEMNFRTRRGEIDVIAQKGDMLIFGNCYSSSHCIFQD